MSITKTREVFSLPNVHYAVDTNNIKERVSRALLLTGYPLFLDFSILISWFNFSYRIILDGKI